MYKLVIVDDEEIIRRGLTNIIEWGAIGFELVATFEDGRKAIEYIQENSVDVVLTDIKMRGISGLDIAQYAHERKAQTKIVIISGYRDFDYAKKAVEYNVVHYLLKPTQFEETERVFKQIKIELDKEKEIKDETARFQHKYKEIMPIMQEQFFIDLLMGALNDKREIKRRMVLLDIVQNLHNCCCLISFNMHQYKEYLTDKWVYGKEKLDNAIRNFFSTKEEGIEYFMVLNNDSDIKVIAFSAEYEDAAQMAEAVTLQLDELGKLIKSVMGLALDLKLERAFHSIMDLPNYKTPNRYELITGAIGDRLNLEPEEYKKLINKYKLFMSIIYDGDKKAVKCLIETFISEMKELPIKVTQHIIIDMFAVLTNKFIELGTDIWEVTRGRIDYKQIVEMKHIESIRNWCEDVLIDIIEYINKNRSFSSDNPIARALEYIEHNYQQDISLDDVADKVFLNSVYFSRLFKRQVGENYTDYLTKIRMEKAIELLKERRYKVYEISTKVGYRNSKYFTRVFKHYAGCTTTEYMKLLDELESDSNG